MVRQKKKVEEILFQTKYEYVRNRGHQLSYSENKVLCNLVRLGGVIYP